MTRIIIRAVLNAGRDEMIDYLKHKLPYAEFCYDRYRNCQETFIRANEAAGDDAVIHMEDDVILTVQFREKIEAAIAERPNDVIQFFSRQAADLAKGSRYIYKFIMGQCYYLPPGMSRKVAEFAKTWPHWEKHPGGIDYMIDDLRKQEKFRIWCHVPSLVQHRISPSLLSTRAMKRQSQSFQDADE